MSVAERKPFQRATVKHVLGQLTAPGSKRRFLVADEVGLGKTLVAQGVLEELIARGGAALPRVVFYMCSSRTIAEQNRTSLLSMIPTDEERAKVTVHADRLGLVAASPPPMDDARFRFYALTPSITSGEGTGRVDERALLVAALREVSTTLRGRWAWKDRMRGNVRPYGWENALARVQVRDARVCAPFRRHLCEELGIAERAWDATLADAVEAGLARATLTTIEAMRRAMTFAVLDVLSPHVVILDEFQRFFEFLPTDEMVLEHEGREEEEADGYAAARRVMRAVLEGVQGKTPASMRPYLLMLSATPYRLYARSIEGGRHHDEFYDLLEFLYDDGGRAARQIKDNFLEYSARLLSEPPQSARVTELRQQIEGMLLQVMCRSERDALVGGASQKTKSRQEGSALKPGDARAFRLLSDIATAAELQAEPYWSSIPYAFQAMDEQYAMRRWGQVPAARPGDRIARLDYRLIRRYAAPEPHYPHPRLRKLVEVVSPTHLALPWLPPTRPWWDLGGPFAEAGGATKTLVFSHFRAVPRILAAVLSYEAEKQVFAGRRFDYAVRRSGARAGGRVQLLQGLRAQPRGSLNLTFEHRRDEAIRTFLLFTSLPALARLGDPLRLVPTSGRLTRAQALAAVRAAIASALPGERQPHGGGPRRLRLLEWVLTLEARAPGEQSSLGALRVALEKWAKEREEEGEAGAAVARHMLGVEPLADTDGPSDLELDELADLALAAPGVVLGRAFDRVFGPCVDEDHAAKRLHGLLDAGLTSLRAYLDAPEWRELFVSRDSGTRSRRLPFAKALRVGVWDGGLEAVLDELFATYCGYAAPAADVPLRERLESEKAALARLHVALSIHGAQVTIHHLRRTAVTDGRPAGFRMRCHAAAPLGLTGSEVAEDNDALRSDRLRVAFNSPFRPMALVTTSIGQEGLDFHTYARRVVHWDLPAGPVELEQRDGRIARFGSHAVRCAMLEAPWLPGLKPNRSPWLEVGKAAKDAEDAAGIQPWWTLPGAAIERVFLIPSLSRMRAEIAELERALGSYRIVLGQPGQERLLRELQARVDAAKANEKQDLMAWYSSEALCLSPFLKA